MPETGRRRVNNTRIDRFQGFIAQTEFFHCAGAEIFDDHIRFLHQILDDLLAFRAFHVDRNALFAAIDADEVEAFVVFERPETARIIPLPGDFDFDDFRAQIG